ncbi:MAG TPA: precorrin-6y C5,15-methyltransferase (decarboxylating) subunit CbiE, partial [Alphaproteobacteria bacterium]|nr:precorrin-6y C5,15-methyltransferase (decarboxylating) subunit CbiE [Alphaproteobacteria bacterium]
LIVNYAETVLGPPRFLAELEASLGESDRPSEFSPADLVNRRGLEAVARALLEDAIEEEPRVHSSDGDLPALVEWEGGIERMLDQVMRLRDSPTVILAGGDPMWFGIGATLARHLEPEEFEVHPHPSAFQLAAAALRWPLQHVDTVSLHGRPVELIHPLIAPGNRILALTSDANTAQEVADLLIARGFSDSMMTVLESLGGPDERTTSAPAIDFDVTTIGDFYVLAVDCVAGPDASLLPRVPGLPDAAFVSDGQLTKREVRAMTLAKLVPLPGQLLWDVGAGCGSIAIEWMRAARDAEAIAFERDEERCEMIATNASALGVPTLRIAAGTAPASLAAMPAPDAIFLGGSVGDEELFAHCWAALKPGGRLVANAVTIAGETALYQRQARHGGELVRIDTAVLDTLGEQQVLRPRLAVLQWSVTKPPQWLAVAP